MGASAAAASGRSEAAVDVRPRAGRQPTAQLTLLWLLLALLAVAVRFPPLSDSLWLDELHTSWTVRAPWSEVANRAAEGNQAPVYFWCVWSLVRCLGESEWTLRLLSVTAGTLLVPAVAWLALLWTRSAILSTLAACLVIFDPHCVYFAREARPYAFVQLLVVAHFLSFTGRLAERPGSRLAWNLTLWLAFFTHCTAALVVAAELMLLAGSRWRRQLRVARLRRGWLQDLGAGVVVVSLAVPYLARLAERRGNWEVFVPVPDVAALARLFAWIPYVAVPLLAAVILSLVAPEESGSCRDETTERSFADRLVARLRWRSWLRCDWPLALILAWYLVPAGLAWTSTRVGLAAIFFRRYLMATAVAWCLFAAWCGLRVRPPGPRLLFAVVVLIAAAVTHSRWIDFYYGRHSSEDWRAAVSCVQELDPTGSQPLWIRPGLIEDAAAENSAMRDYLQFPVRGLYPVAQSADDVEILSRGWTGWSDRQWERLGRQPSGLLLARGTLEMRQSLPARCDAAARERGGRFDVLEVQGFPGLTVIRFHAVVAAQGEKER